MRTIPALLVIASIGLALGGAVTLMWIVLGVALALHLAEVA